MDDVVLIFEMPCPDPFQDDVHDLSFDVMSDGRVEVMTTAHEQRHTFILSREQRRELIAYLGRGF